MIILTGKSASGKTTIVKELMDKYGYQKFITYTTRPMRTGERQDIDYHFVSKEEFLKKKEEGFFIETVEYSGYYYGSSFNDLGDNKVLIVDVNGANNFASQETDLIKKKSAFFYIECSDNVAQKRMENRGDAKENIDKRLKSDKILFGRNNMKRIDCVIDTEKYSLEESTQQILDFYLDFINQNK